MSDELMSDDPMSDEPMSDEPMSDATKAYDPKAYDPKAILCPYCGDAQKPALACRSCGGSFDQWSLAATQNDMGTWQVRDSSRPHFIGLSHEAIVAAIRAGEIGMNSIVRGPTTRQFWTLARRAPGIAHLFGRCHACQSPVAPAAPSCSACGTVPSTPPARNFAGLPAIERVATPADAVPDLAGFIEDSGVLLVRVTAVAEERVAVAPVVVAAPTPTPTPTPRDAVSIVDRALAERTRKLERTNRALFAAVVVASIGAVVLFFFLFDKLEQNRRLQSIVRQRDAEIAKAKQAQDERDRKAPAAVTPVVNAPQPELPKIPETPRATP